MPGFITKGYALVTTEHGHLLTHLVTGLPGGRRDDLCAADNARATHHARLFDLAALEPVLTKLASPATCFLKRIV